MSGNREHFRDALKQLACKLNATPFKQRGVMLETFAAQYGISKQTVYRRLQTVGWASDRKPRTDRGTTSQCETTLNELAATLKIGVRKNGKTTMETPNARSLLAANGRDFKVSNSQINSLLRDRHLSIKNQKQATPYIRMRSLHANHVHQVDPSLCLIYYLKGKQHIITDAEWYKNKPDHDKIEKNKVWRYVLTDHFSNTTIVHYYQAKGESQENLYDFLLYAWQKLAHSIFHGVPKILYWDKGSANTAKAIKNALKSLGVEALAHEAGNPRAKGSVEGANNIVEKLFESRLKYEPVDDVDHLNNAVESWYNAYNSNAIPEYDSRLKRPGMSVPVARYGLWQTIKKDQLRILPEPDICRFLLSADVVERKVKNDLSISYKHPKADKTALYCVKHIAEVYAGFMVNVAPLIYGPLQIIVSLESYDGTTVEHIVEPIAFDTESGFPLDAPVFGEGYKSVHDTVIETAGKEAIATAYPEQNQDEIKKSMAKNAAPFDGKLDAHSHLAHVTKPDFMARTGTELNVPNRMNVEIKPLTHIEAIKKLRTYFGRAITAEENQMIRKAYPDGVPEDAFSALVECIKNPGVSTTAFGG